MNVPPKILKSHVESHLPARDLRGVYINRSASGQEPLPVLQAFQSFLEIERRRTRNRILALSGIFLVVLLLVGGVVTALGLVFTGQMRADMAGLQRDVTAVKDEALKVKGEAEAVLAAFEGEAAKLRGEVLAAQATNASVSATSAGEYAAGMAQTRTALETLQRDNEALKANLTKLQGEYPALSNSIHRIIADLLRAQPKTEEPIVARIDARPEKTMVAAMASKLATRDLVITVTPSNGQQTVPWCVSIPE